MIRGLRPKVCWLTGPVRLSPSILLNIIVFGVFSKLNFIAYIPLQCETPCVGDFRIANTNMPHRPNASVSQPNASANNPNVSRLDICRGRYPRVGFAMGMYISCCLCQFCLR